MRKVRCYVTYCFLSLLWLSSCDIEPSNPYDPEAPPSDRARSALSGSVITEAAEAEQARIELPGAGVSVSPGADGTFSIEGVSPGTHLVRAVAPGHFPVEEELDLGPGERIRTSISLFAMHGGLSGRVVLSGEESHAAVMVTASLAALPGAGAGSAKQLKFTAFSDSSGAYSLDDIPVGTYNLSVEKAGFTRASLAGIEVVPSSSTPVPRIELKPLSGKLTLKGGPDYDSPAYDNIHFTRTRTVRIEIYGFTGTRMMVSEDQSFSGADWQPYGSSFEFELSPGDGEKSVYMLVEDDQGNRSEVMEGHTVLDTEPPAPDLCGVTIDGGADFTADPSGLVTLQLRAADDLTLLNIGRLAKAVLAVAASILVICGLWLWQSEAAEGPAEPIPLWETVAAPQQTLVAGSDAQLAQWIVQDLERKNGHD